MYRHILIPTDGSELAEHAVTNGLLLAKSVGAKVTVIIAEDPFDWVSVSETRASQRRALDALEQVKKHAASVLSRAADAAKQAGVPAAVFPKWAMSRVRMSRSNTAGYRIATIRCQRWRPISSSGR